MTIEMKELGNRINKHKATFTIDVDLLNNFKKIAKSRKKKLSPIVEDLLKIYIQQEQSLI